MHAKGQAWFRSHIIFLSNCLHLAYNVMVDLRKLVDGTTKNIPNTECQEWLPANNIQFEDLDKLIGRLGHTKNPSRQ